MKRLFILLIPFFITLYSCDKENTDAGLTSEEASSEISSIASKVSADIIKMNESDGINGMIDLVESYIFTAREDDEGNVTLQVSEIFQDFVTGPFSEISDNWIESLDDIKGLYVWNPETEAFDKSASDFFIVQFPTEESSSNNAEFKITQLELAEITEYYDGFTDEYLLPSLIEAYLQIDDKVVISLDLDVEWSSDGFPNLAKVELVIEPYSLTIGFDDLQDKSSSLLSMLRLNGKDILGIDVDMEFETESKDEPPVVEGYIFYGNLKVSGEADLALDEDEDVNEFTDLEVFIDNKKVGDIVFKGDDEIPYIQYLDGTTEEIEILFEEAIEEIEEAIERIEDASEAVED